MTRPLTRELVEALEQWLRVWAGDDPPAIVCGPTHSELKRAYRAYRDSSEAEPFRVGDRVRGTSGHESAEGPIVAIWYDVQGSNPYPGRFKAEELEPIPTLPDDHLDRFWVVGAWIQGRADDHFYLVLSEDEVVRIPGGDTLPRDGGWYETGWSFHPDSPIQEQKE